MFKSLVAVIVGVILLATTSGLVAQSKPNCNAAYTKYKNASNKYKSDYNKFLQAERSVDRTQVTCDSRLASQDRKVAYYQGKLEYFETTFHGSLVSMVFGAGCLANGVRSGAASCTRLKAQINNARKHVNSAKRIYNSTEKQCKTKITRLVATEAKAKVKADASEVAMDQAESLYEACLASQNVQGS